MLPSPPPSNPYPTTLPQDPNGVGNAGEKKKTVLEANANGIPLRMTAG